MRAFSVGYEQNYNIRANMAERSSTGEKGMK